MKTVDVSIGDDLGLRQAIDRDKPLIRSARPLSARSRSRSALPRVESETVSPGSFSDRMVDKLPVSPETWNIEW